MPPLRRRITVPSKTWMRSRVPSTTRAETRTGWPEASSGRSVRICSAVISSSTFTFGPYSSLRRRCSAAMAYVARSQAANKAHVKKATGAADGEAYHNLAAARPDGMYRAPRLSSFDEVDHDPHDARCLPHSDANPTEVRVHDVGVMVAPAPGLVLVEDFAGDHPTLTGGTRRG